MILDGLDRLIVEFDKALRTVTGPAVSSRPHPDAETLESDLSEDERRHAAALMRVNHSGEVCAQALYQGQALTSRDPGVVDALRSAAHEETEHLAWTEKRIRELAGHTSYLNPLWYAGSLAIGVVAGRFGDRWNLGFLSETERQVEMHLDAHMARLPEQDRRSWEILKQMKLDEIRHADTADALGAAQLPGVVRGLMRLSSKVMTRTAYYV